MDKLFYDRKAVGQRVRAKRKRLNLSQEALSEKIDKSPKHCADIERGSCGMSIDTLLALSWALEASPSTLLLGDALPAVDLPDSTREIISALVDCTEEQRQGILTIIRLFTRAHLTP